MPKLDCDAAIWSYCFFSSVLPSGIFFPLQADLSPLALSLLQQELPDFSPPLEHASFFSPPLLQQPADLLDSLLFVHSPLFLSSADLVSVVFSDFEEVAVEPMAELLDVCVVDLDEVVDASLWAFAAKAKNAKALRIKIFFITEEMWLRLSLFSMQQDT